MYKRGEGEKHLLMSKHQMQQEQYKWKECFPTFKLVYNKQKKSIKNGKGRKTL